MLTFKKKLTTITFLLLFSAAAFVSCGKQSSSAEHPTGEHPADSSEHPADSTEHPSASTDHPSEHPAEHPSDSTNN